MKQLCSILIFLVCTNLWAEEGVFLAPMEKSEINLIEAALRGRGWEILERDNSHIRAEASNVGRGVEAEISIFYIDGGFRYKGSAVKKKRKPGFSGNTPVTKRHPTEIPPKWLRLLRRDVGQARQIQTLHRAEKADSTTALDSESRLTALKSLYDKGLISKDEYHTRRKEILAEI